MQQSAFVLGSSYAVASSYPWHFCMHDAEVGEVMHGCKDELVCKCTLEEKVPYFNGRLFLENMEEIGKVDEILGPIRSFVGSCRASKPLMKSFL